MTETAQGVKAAAAAYLAEHGEVDIEALIAAEEAEAAEQEAEQESGEAVLSRARCGYGWRRRDRREGLSS